MAVCKCGAYLSPEFENCTVCGRSTFLQNHVLVEKSERRQRRRTFRLKYINSARLFSIITGFLFLSAGLLPWIRIEYEDNYFDASPTLISNEFGLFCVLGGGGLIIISIFYVTYARGLLAILLVIAFLGSFYELYSMYDAYNQLTSLGTLFGYESNAQDILSYISQYVVFKFGIFAWFAAMCTGIYASKALNETYL